MRPSPLVALAALALACAPPSHHPGDEDGGTAPRCATTHAVRHTSYVPPDFTPKDAARLVVMGDSISTGTGATKPATDGYFALFDQNDAAAWPTEAKTDVTTFFGHAVPVVNVAVNGATTSDLAQELANVKADLGDKPKGHTLVVITIGGNDLQSVLFQDALGGNVDPAGQPLDDALSNISDTVTELQNQVDFPDGMSIELMDVYDPSDGEGKAQGCFAGQSFPQFVPALDTWRTKYLALGTQLHFAVVDALGHFHGHGMNFGDTANKYYQKDDPTPWFASDCIHPNDRGHDELRRLFYEALDCQYVATP